MNVKISTSNFTCTLAVALLAAFSMPLTSHAQSSNGNDNNGRPTPSSPQAAQNQDDGNVRVLTGENLRRQAANGGAHSTRRQLSDEPVIANFDDTSIMDLIPFIVETTGKVVMPVRPQVLRNQKITLMNDEPLPPSQLVDLLFQTFRQNQVAVIEHDNLIILNMVQDARNSGELPVLGPNVDVMTRRDIGTFVIKIFALTEVTAENVAEKINELKPEYATISVDPNSNQILLLADIALAQRVQELIWELDRNYMQEISRSFVLNYADAGDIQQNILDLFESAATQPGAAARPQQQARAGQPRTATTGTPTPQAPLRLTTSISQNTVSVIGERSIVDEIERLIKTYWDLPRPEGSARMYKLKYTDSIKVRDTLNELLSGSGGAGARAAAAGQQRPGAGASSVTAILGGIYQIEAFPETNGVIVLAKTEASLNFLDLLIEELDQPSEAGLPMVIELKHADAFELAEQINALLSEAGSQTSIERPQRGLTGQIGNAIGGGATTGGGQGGAQQQQAQDWTPPWTRSQRADDRIPESPLIGYTRVVPISRRNALAVLAPPSMRESMRNLILEFDQPGRQVMIIAVIAEVQLNDQLALGLRISSSGDILTSGSGDNRLVATSSIAAQENNVFGSLFDTSVLNVGVDINAVFQALNEVTNVRVLQSPRVFTADNQEASFFDGQDVPFLSNSSVTDVGGITQSTDYRPVGIFLNVRPRITVNQEIDLDVYLELSDIVPGVTQFGAFIIDRRVTETHVLLQNQQTIVLSGIMTDRESQIRRKVPFLSELPLIGALFTSVEDRMETSELIAFITPIIVENTRENYTNFNEDARQRLNELAQPLGKQTKDQPAAAAEIRQHIIPDDIRPRQDQ